jgi:uncharacterized protein (PEP-CTERM system associated)
LFYPDNQNLNDVRHTLNASLNAELIERYFFINVRANANQAIINPRVNSGFDSFSNPDNFAQRASISVTPRIRLPVLDGRFATVNIQPGVGFDFTANTANGTEGLRIGTTNSSISVRSGPIFTTVPWSLTWRRQLFDVDTNQGIGSFASRVGYVFSPRYRFDVILGYDDSSNGYTGSNGETRGLRWETIFRWTPSTRAGFDFGVGQRYFGTTYRFNGRYRHKRCAFRSSYNVTIQNAATALQEQQVVDAVDVFGNPIEDPFDDGQVLTTSVTNPALIQDTFLRDQFVLVSAYSKARNSASLRWFVTRRLYDQADLDTLDNQLTLTLSRRLTTRLRAAADFNVWDHSEQQDSGFDYFQHDVNLRVNYQVGPRSSIGARVGRLNRDANQASGNFSENRFSLDFNFRL